MTDISDTKRVADAINSLASVIVEIIVERVRHSGEVSDRGIKELPASAAGWVLNKRELAGGWLCLGLSTVGLWMKHRRL